MECLDNEIKKIYRKTSTNDLLHVLNIEDLINLNPEWIKWLILIWAEPITVLNTRTGLKMKTLTYSVYKYNDCHFLAEKAILDWEGMNTQKAYLTSVGVPAYITRWKTCLRS